MNATRSSLGTCREVRHDAHPTNRERERLTVVAEVDAIGAFAQGASRKDAASMLAGLIELMVEHPGFKVTVT